MKIGWKTAISAIWLAGMGASAQAESPWSAGGVLIGSSPIYLGQDARIMAFPSVSYKGEVFSFDVSNGLSVPVSKASSEKGYFASLNAAISPHMPPSFGDDARMKGMERDFSADIGIKGSVGWAFLFLDFDGKADVLGVYEGYEVSLSAGMRQRVGQGGLSAKIGAKLRDENLGQYLYGVYDDEARTGRPAFTPGAKRTTFGSLSLFYPIKENVSFFGSLSYEDLSPYKDSPILDAEGQTSLILGVNYTF